MMGASHVLEGELVREWVEYESDGLEIGGVDILAFVLAHLGPGHVEDVGTVPGYHEKTHLGRVRLTLDVIE